jgi:hypothetical protein
MVLLNVHLKSEYDNGISKFEKLAEVGKKIVGGAADVLGNISGEMKKP